MKRLLTALLGLTGLLPLRTAAQDFPTVPPAAPADLQGEALRAWLRQNWYAGKRTVLDYGTARGRMYNYIDNHGGKVVCVYSGYSENVTFNATGTNPGVVRDINCEHSIPQSWFNERLEQRSDIHHLYPTRIQWNSDRGSDPFADIPDASTTGWLRGTTRLTSIPTSNIDEYSEDTNAQFEPREDHKGNLARTAFYFYTMHVNAGDFDTGKNVLSALADPQTLYRWHLADPVDDQERERNRRTAAAQGNYNPYINDPALVARAWGFAPAGPVLSFSAATASVAEGNVGTSLYTATISANPAPTAALTVQVALDAAGTTASSGADFSFSSPQTVTFAAGQTTATVAVTINGDTQPEADETLTLTLQSPGTGALVGGVTSQTLTISNDDGTPPTVRFATATGSIAEGNTGTSTYTVAVSFEGPLPAGGFTVPVTVEAGSTAASPADYALNTNTLNFSGNTPQQTVSVTINGDATFEGNETLRLRLGVPSNATVLLGTPASHVLTISNDDAVPNGGQCANLYFSEYVESGSGNNVKVVEIYNPTSAPVDLDGFRVELFEPGAPTARTRQPLSGLLAPGAVFVVANVGVTSAEVKAKTQLESDVCYFSGGHVLALFDGTDTLDIIGQVGKTPPGGNSPAWPLPGGGSTRDNTLVRKASVGRGSTRWNSADGAASWQTVGLNIFTGVGSHSSTACQVGTGTQSAALRGGLELFPNPATETLRLRLPAAAGSPAATVELLDNLGRVVRSRAAVLGAAGAQFDLRGLPAGLYGVRVRTAGGLYAGRVVVD